MPGVHEFAGLLRDYLGQLQLPLDIEQLGSSPAQKLASIGWIERGGRVLLVQRRQEPFAGRWTAPGGKLELGETPPAALIREMGEETGLIVRRFHLRLITSETGRAGYNWVTFVFRCPVTEQPAHMSFRPEGVLAWVPLPVVPQRCLPSVDRLLLPYIFPGVWRPEDVIAAGRGCEPDQGAGLARLFSHDLPIPDPAAVYFAQIRYGDDQQVEQLQICPLRPALSRSPNP
ncbi:MAG: NUDIX domain-containing protein [Limnochordaceae bacterium]|nr:NUDIX domain-containing protein [Limnochordaceae bacterium]